MKEKNNREYNYPRNTHGQYLFSEVAVGDNMDGMPTYEALNQREEETKRMVEIIEAEERKLEENLEYQRRLEEERKLEQTLEYQRRIEEEAKKQRHGLMNHSKAVIASCQNDPQSCNIDDISPVVREGISFGDLHFPDIRVEFDTDKQKDAASNKGEPVKGRSGMKIVEKQLGLPRASPVNDASDGGTRKANKTGRQLNQKHKQGSYVCKLLLF
jgi:hypothetical protein